MTRNEYLEAKYEEMRRRYRDTNRAFNINPSIARIDPFMIADGLYYVGDKKVCIHLIDTGDGLVLLDSGYLGAAHLLVDSIWRAGFDLRDVKWIIHSHGHSDHFGATDEFRSMYGTKAAISRIDAEILRSPKPHVDTMLFPLAVTPTFDLELEDGDVFELGWLKMRCVLTPGHTEGVLSFFFDVTYDGKTYTAAMFGGAGTNAITLPYIFHNNSPADSPRIMLDSLEKVRGEKVDIQLGNHPYNNHTIEKREKQLGEGGNPFIAPNDWQEFLNSTKKKIEKAIESNKAMELEMSSVCEQ